MKKIVSLFLFFLFSSIIVAQENYHLDSLKSELKNALHDSSKILLLLKLATASELNSPDSSLYYAKACYTLAHKLNNESFIGKSHNALGDAYWYLGDNGKSTDNYLKALDIFEKQGDRLALATSYRNVGWAFNDQKKFKEALDYHSKSLKINLDSNRLISIVNNYNDIGLAYSDLEQPENAIESFKNAIKICRENHFVDELPVIYINLGEVYSKQKNYSLAIECAKKSISLSDQIGNKHFLTSSLLNLGKYYNKMGSYNQAISSLQRVEELAKQISNLRDQIDVNQELAFAYKQKNELEKVIKYLTILCELKDSLNNQSTSIQALELTARHENEKKELIINNLEREKALSGEKLKREQNFKIYLSVFCLFVVCFAFVLFRNNMQKIKTHKALSIAYNEIENKNKEITDSIDYARTIQKAILPTVKQRLTVFEKSFVLFKAKDIVSGDFYWLSQKNGKRIIAACDCTGHGVPGALMSMIGSNILNHIVNEKGITTPNLILEELNKAIREALKQDEQSESRDGMDIAIIAMDEIVNQDSVKTKIEFAGAHRPLWVIEPLDAVNYSDIDSSKIFIGNGFKLTEIKGDKVAIGGAELKKEVVFNNHELVFSKEACLYISSDGYADQFSSNDKKLMNARFKEILISIQYLSMSEQEKFLDNFIQDFRGKRDQVDDILVIGLKA